MARRLQLLILLFGLRDLTLIIVMTIVRGEWPYADGFSFGLVRLENVRTSKCPLQQEPGYAASKMKRNAGRPHRIPGERRAHVTEVIDISDFDSSVRKADIRRSR